MAWVALVLADVATLEHARKAIAAGADGLVLLSAGAGGQTGWLNGMAFVRALRQEYDGPIVLAGGISDGVALRAAQVLGCDLAYMGTRFIATRESLAPDAYRSHAGRMPVSTTCCSPAPSPACPPACWRRPSAAPGWTRPRWTRR